ncbi:HNH endonuclease signature motif containing protein [Acidovorax sp. NCPPB 3576]|uniref:HNH endonuclease signature motif containing protein n=1 Tax=Acidovorax sp. NCPPB 3576 TaxID=2940488 RepID=UPI002349D5BE|nr:HNH endonuclease signature motif containing protein [Acidovorax sp. NCPPB 3576]WCM88814.1 HNH endonuclease [Acidovorax sp. NCPPB 3576]
MKSIALLEPWQVEKVRSKLASRLTQAEGGCHLLIGRGRYSNGYQLVSAGGFSFSAHRLAYELKHGPISPSALSNGNWWVLHKCDVPNCCNPDHLYLGTAKDNARDRAMRARMSITDRAQCRRWRKPEDIGTPVGTVFWEIEGEVRELREWAEKFRVPEGTLDLRLKAGWPPAHLDMRPKIGNRVPRQEKHTYKRLSGLPAVQAHLSRSTFKGKRTSTTQQRGQPS